MKRDNGNVTRRAFRRGLIAEGCPASLARKLEWCAYHICKRNEAAVQAKRDGDPEEEKLWAEVALWANHLTRFTQAVLMMFSEPDED